MLLSLAEKCVTHLLWPASGERKEVEYIQDQWKVSIGEKQDWDWTELATPEESDLVGER